MFRRLAYGYTCVIKIFLRLWVAIRYRNKEERKDNLKKTITKIEKKYLSRYLYVLNQPYEEECNNLENIIWLCWLQGEKKMPPVVKKCVESIRKQCPHYKLIILSNENIYRYVSFPQYIAEKRYKGIISNTHFSDILRVCLLAKYGGIWIDATVYLSAPLPSEIINADFFAYHVNSFVHSNNWFIKAKAGNLLITNMVKLLLEYWKYENHMIDYFFFHIFFDLMIEKNRECAIQWQKVPVLYDDCYELEANFFQPYSKEKWDEINAKTHIHKLSWKYKKQPQNGDFLSALLSDKLEETPDENS